MTDTSYYVSYVRWDGTSTYSKEKTLESAQKRAVFAINRDGAIKLEISFGAPRNFDRRNK